MPTEELSIEKLNIFPESARKRCLLQLVRPDDFKMTVNRYVKSMKPTASVTVVKEITKLHGLSGRRSNAAKSAPRNIFRTYVRIYRSSTGRKLDSHSCTHGARSNLDYKWQILVPIATYSFPDDRPSFYSSFLDALKSKNMYRWYRKRQ